MYSKTTLLNFLLDFNLDICLWKYLKIPYSWEYLCENIRGLGMVTLGGTSLQMTFTNAISNKCLTWPISSIKHSEDWLTCVDKQQIHQFLATYTK